MIGSRRRKSKKKFVADGSHCSVYLTLPTSAGNILSGCFARSSPKGKKNVEAKKSCFPPCSFSHQPVGGKDETESTFARASAVAEVVDSLFDVENQKPNQRDCEGSRLVLVIVVFLHHFSAKRR